MGFTAFHLDIATELVSVALYGTASMEDLVPPLHPPMHPKLSLGIITIGIAAYASMDFPLLTEQPPGSG